MDAEQIRELMQELEAVQYRLLTTAKGVDMSLVNRVGFIMGRLQSLIGWRSAVAPHDHKKGGPE